ncbi:hypothetical protein MIR68_008639 [Amoeboaphelidium protococcarum]|nr:hypothetical protein MIR68_008639 [Amoeboaphelidium protococcarum]KAI3644177.1 hypothetical protein MP228_010341 [Amoeboaphelidium protococcarum]
MRLSAIGNDGRDSAQPQTVAPPYDDLGTRQKNQHLIAMVPQQPIGVVRVQTRTRYRGSLYPNSGTGDRPSAPQHFRLSETSF